MDVPSTTPGLFDDDPMTTLTGAALVPRPISFGQSKKAKAVNRLLAQVESLRAQFGSEKRRLDEALIFHAAQIAPRQQRVTALRSDIVRSLARFLDDRRLSKGDKRILCEFLMEQLDAIPAHVERLDPDLAHLFERLHGVSFEDAAQSEIEDARSEMAEFFDEIGLDMEVPDLRADMTEEEAAATAAQMADRLRQLYEAQAQRAAGRPKTKRELREEKRAERQAELRKMSIGGIYKRLVKVLHPDLEPDPAAREHKGAVMQKVTTAYAENDLPTLLRLELEWIAGAGEDAARRTDETLNAYAEVLKQQAAQLRLEITSLPLRPKYQPLLGDNPFGGASVIDVSSEAERLDFVIDELSAGLERMADERAALNEVRELARLHRQARRGRARTCSSAIPFRASVRPRP